MEPDKELTKQLDKSNIRKVLQKADRSLSWHIECNTNLHSICTLSIFTEILKKETIKYEIGYESLENDVNFVLYIDSERYLLTNRPEGLCECDNREISGVGIVYELAKSLDFITEATLWPVAVAYSFYRDFILPDGDIGNSRENAHNVAEWRKNRASPDGRYCSWCFNTHADILAQIKIINCQNDGMFYKNATALPFLKSSCLFTTLKNDLNFIFMSKLFSNRSKHGDRKVSEILAGAGISIAMANEKYTSMGQSVQEIVDRTFGTRDVFIFKSGHDLEIQAIEHALLVLFYLYRGRGLYGLLSMRKKKLIDVERAGRFYQNIIKLFKDGVTYHRNLKNVVVFQLRGVKVTEDEARILFGVLYRLFRRYIIYQYSKEIPGLIVGALKTNEEDVLNNKAILYLKGFKKTKGQLKGIDKVSEDLFTIDYKDLRLVIEHMF
ncbi:hypothetical protein PAEPH01_0915 [Pancytospora epiphaga]|nr:hypothetical protein PAEPH01_0915 [Pancytospora epiphaga]